MTICYFGSWRRDYARNRLLQRAFRHAGAVVVEVWEERSAIGCWRLLRRGLEAEFDVLVVGFPGYTTVAVARVLGWIKRKPVVFDAFVSLYETRVVDRREVRPLSLQAWAYWLGEQLLIRCADFVLLDTAEHAGWFERRYRLPTERVGWVWVGADDEVMRCTAPVDSAEMMTVFFYGGFIPLQGVEVIAEAAAILQAEHEPVRLILLGDGVRRPGVQRRAEELRLRNLEFVEPVPYERLYDYIVAADVCLGLFGAADKASRVVPNKVFDALAVGRAVVTRASPASQGLLTNRENAVLVPPGDPAALAQALVNLRRDPALRLRLAAAGRARYQELAGPESRAQQVAEVVHRVRSLNSARRSRHAIGWRTPR